MQNALDPNQRSLVELTADECLELLATQEVGRLGVVDGGYPLIYPVNYVLDGETVLIRTSPGTKLAAARMDRVSFEVDHLNQGNESGWSVLVHGFGVELRRPPGRVPAPWAPGDKSRILQVIPVTITGRLLTNPPRGGAQ